jgi:hypothetical protein
MAARTSEYTFEEALRLSGRRFKVVFPLGELPVESLVEIENAEPCGDGYAVYARLIYSPTHTQDCRVLLRLRDLRDHAREC